MRGGRGVHHTFLRHGLGDGNALVGIDQVERGRTALGCPYCASLLIAKKGRVLVPHFAHDGPSCRESADRRASHIPFYDDLDTVPGLERSDLRLCASLLRTSINVTSFRGWRRAALARLLGAGLLEEVPRGQRWVNGLGSHRHTDWGTKMAGAVRGRLTLSALAAVQERAMIEKLDRLETEAVADPTAATDLDLYRAQLGRVLSLNLYLLEVTADGRVLHKIGVTSRGVEGRLVELRADLSRHFDEIELNVSGVWSHRGSLELYFKRLFARRRARIGTFTEYFNFEEPSSGGGRYRRPFTMLAKLAPWTLPPRLGRLCNSPRGEFEGPTGSPTRGVAQDQADQESRGS